MRRLIAYYLGVMAFLGAGCSSKDVNHNGTKEIMVSVVPAVNTLVFGDSVKFYANVYNTNQRAVVWFVNSDSAGNDSLGRIRPINDTSAYYVAPLFFGTITFDSVVVRARSLADTSKFGSAVARILHPEFVFVDSALGNDQTGIGSIFHPYRTMTKGLSKTRAGQTMIVGPGTYYDGEVFPLTPTFKVKVKGRGRDSTRVRATPSTQLSNAAFLLRIDSVRVEDLSVVSLDPGQGIAFSISTTADSTAHIDVGAVGIDGCYLGIAVGGRSRYVTLREITINSCVYGIRIGTTGGETRIFDSWFEDIDSVGVLIDTAGYVYLGEQILPGGNHFVSSGAWCLKNLAPHSIMAGGNYWPSSDSVTIDTLYIYDDDENPQSGEVIYWPLGPEQ